jgi:hypothetical protein
VSDGGKVVGESPGVGLSMELDEISTGGTAREVLPDLAVVRPRRLGGWEYVRAAERAEDRAVLEPVVGVRPRAASGRAAGDRPALRGATCD